MLENPIEIPVLMTCSLMAFERQALNLEPWCGWDLLEIALLIAYRWTPAGVKIIRRQQFC